MNEAMVVRCYLGSEVLKANGIHLTTNELVDCWPTVRRQLISKGYNIPHIIRIQEGKYA